MSKKKLKQSKPTKLIDVDLSLNFRIVNPYKLTENQQRFYDISIQENSNIIICDGPAGTSKSFCSVLVALKMLQKKQASKIIYIRSIVESATRKLGALPGEVDDKFKPWITPLLEKCDELVESHVTNSLIRDEYISCVPVNFLRGSTFKDCVVIVDEAQNLELSEIVTVLTRLGTNCKMFIIGDTMQSDINKSCFRTICNAFLDEESTNNGIYSFKFTDEDIVRSNILKFIISRVRSLK